MPFNIPNYDDATYSDQSEPDSIDFNIIATGISGDGVVSGCAVTSNNDMTFAVASGSVQVDGVISSVSSGNVTIGTADATNARFDLITVDSVGTKGVTAGTASTNPVFPIPSSTSVVLASVYIPANATSLTSANLVDKRVFVPSYATSTHNHDTAYSSTSHTHTIATAATGGIYGVTTLNDSTASTSSATAATLKAVNDVAVAAAAAQSTANTAYASAISAYSLANSAIPQSIVDAKGDLIVGSANDTVVKVGPIGADGTVLTADAASTGGMKWATAATSSAVTTGKAIAMSIVFGG